MSFISSRLHRADDQVILRQLETGLCKVFLLYGQSGTGKTSLLNALTSEFSAIHAFDYFVKHVCSSVHTGNESIDWLVQDVAQRLISARGVTGGRLALEDQIIRVSCGSKCFITIDNAEHIPDEWLKDFVGRWISASAHSILFVVSSREVVPSLQDHRLTRRQLEGFAEQESDSVLALLGDELTRRFKKEELLNAANRLSRFPQYLLYLRWLDPKDGNELNEISRRIQDGKFSIEDLWSVIREDSRDLVHFLSIGLISKLEVDNELLSFLWDMLGCGGAEKYNRILRYLLAERFMAPVAGNEGRFALHPSLHIQLERLLNRVVGNEHVTHVIYYLSIYFRRKMYNRNEIDIDAMHQYIIYAIRSMNTFAAANFILSKQISAKVHSQGVSLGYRDVVSRLNAAIQDQYRDQESRPSIAELKSRLGIELARCECALSNYERCLQILCDVDRSLLSQPDPSALAANQEEALYIRGIAEGCLGNGDKSQQAYGSLVELAIERGFITSLAAECIGYLALVESFRDADKAVLLAAEAVRFARSYHDPDLLATTLCSTAQVMLYTGRYNEAAQQLHEARSLHTSNVHDIREFGRLLIAMGMYHIIRGQMTMALEFLERASAINERIGDLRRLQRANFLIAVCRWYGNEREAAMRALEDIVRSFAALDDKFYGAAASLVYFYALGARSVEHALMLPTRAEGGVWAHLKRTDSSTLQRIWTGIVEPLMSAKAPNATTEQDAVQ